MVTDQVSDPIDTLLIRKSEPDNGSCPPHGSLGQVLPVPLLVQVGLCLEGEFQLVQQQHSHCHSESYLVEAPAKASLHGDGKGGFGRLVGQLRPLGGHHKALVVGGSTDLECNVTKTQKWKF